MKSLGKRMLIVIEKIGGTLFSIITIFIFSKWFPKVFKTTESNAKCMILGNGPSLSNQFDEVKNLRNQYSLLCVNDFPNSMLFDELRPDYLTLMDPEYWICEKENIPKCTIVLFDSLNRKVNWEFILFLPYEMKSVASRAYSEFIKGKWISIIYFNRTPVSGFSAFKFMMFKSKLGMPFAQNVLVSAIFLMLNAKFKEIILFGADHSWHEQIIVTKDNMLCVRQEHFKYDQDEGSIYVKEESYNPVYKFSDSSRGMPLETFKVHEIFEAWSRAFHGYWVLKDYAKFIGARIVNLSTKTYIDAFGRSLYE